MPEETIDQPIETVMPDAAINQPIEIPAKSKLPPARKNAKKRDIENKPVVMPEMMPEDKPVVNPYRIYVTFVSNEKMGKRHLYGALVLQTDFEDIVCEAHISQVLNYIQKSIEKEDVTILSWVALDN